MATIKIAYNAYKGLKSKQEFWADLPTALMVDFTVIGLGINRIIIWIL